MKGSFVFIILLIAIITATVQHVNKHNDEGDRIDKLAAGLREVTDHLPTGASFTFRMPENPRLDAYMLWRYLLAPGYCSIDPAEKFDTVLSIYNMNISDSTLQSLCTGREIICSSNDGQYKYYLTCSHK